MTGDSKYQLAQKQSLPLEQKIILSHQRIIEWYDHWDGQVYISTSGGLDSTVLTHLVRTVRPDVPAVFCNTGVEFPENIKHVKKTTNLEIIRPKLMFHEVIEKWGYPVVSKEQSQYIYEYRNTNSEKLRHLRWHGNDKRGGAIFKKWRFLIDAPFKISDKCCDELKKKPFKKYERRTGRKGILGIRAIEGHKRVQDYGKYGCNAYETKRPLSRPMSFWLDDDVWEYLKTYNLEYSDLYNKGYTRSGCFGCLFGIHNDDNQNRMLTLKETHPKLHDYCIYKLKINEVLDYLGVEYEPKEGDYVGEDE